MSVSEPVVENLSASSEDGKGMQDEQAGPETRTGKKRRGLSRENVQGVGKGRV